MAILKIAVSQQLGENTCWAAVTSAVASFYDPATIYTQCFILTYYLGGNCCNDMTNCDQTGSTVDALTLTKNFRDISAGLCSFDLVKQEITNNNPIVLRVNWNGTIDLHVIVLCGFENDQSVWVLDPANQFTPRNIKFAELQIFYRNLNFGEIIGSIFLQSSNAAGAIQANERH